MSAAVLSIGSNLGDRLRYLQGALDALRPWVRGVSPVYETPPWGPVEQQPFLNAVLLADDPDATAIDWLDRARGAEIAAERVREVRWGPRTLDVDVIAVDDLRSADPELVLPHPRAVQRAFVLVPWFAVDPAARLPEGSVADLIEALDPVEVAGVVARPELVLS
jgi:2-amino-4-hydroxy-6-hydroxymethyldihydropteridine diphosphokinase